MALGVYGNNSGVGIFDLDTLAMRPLASTMFCINCAISPDEKWAIATGLSGEMVIIDIDSNSVALGPAFIGAFGGCCATKDTAYFCITSLSELQAFEIPSGLFSGFWSPAFPGFPSDAKAAATKIVSPSGNSSPGHGLMFVTYPGGVQSEVGRVDAIWCAVGPDGDKGSAWNYSDQVFNTFTASTEAISAGIFIPLTSISDGTGGFNGTLTFVASGTQYIYAVNPLLGTLEGTMISTSDGDAVACDWYSGNKRVYVANNSYGIDVFDDTTFANVGFAPTFFGGGPNCIGVPHTFQAVAPPIRQKPRDDNLALGAVRQAGTGPNQPTSYQYSVRQGRNTYA